MPELRLAYQSERCTLYAGDCTNLIGRLPTVDLLCTDPPYGVRWNSGMNGGRFGPLLGDDGSLNVPGMLGTIVRAHLRPNRHVYVFGFQPSQLAEPLQLGGTAELIWDKVNIGMGDLSKPWAPQHEPITFGTHHPGKAKRASGGGQPCGAATSRDHHPSPTQERHPGKPPPDRKARPSHGRVDRVLQPTW